MFSIKCQEQRKDLIYLKKQPEYNLLTCIFAPKRYGLFFVTTFQKYDHFQKPLQTIGFWFSKFMM